MSQETNLILQAAVRKGVNDIKVRLELDIETLHHLLQIVMQWLEHNLSTPATKEVEQTSRQ